MAFSIDGIVIDRINRGVAEDDNGQVLFTLTQLADATVEITSESKEARDKDGTLIKKFYTGKSGTFTANNALIDFNIMAAGTGSPKEEATTSAPIVMPCIRSVKKGTTEATITGLKADTVKVVGLNASGSKIATYAKDTAAGATAFAVSGEKITLPTDTAATEFLIDCERSVTSGVKVQNRADKFPKTIALTLQCFAIEPCTPGTVRLMYLRIPSFQVSPDTSLALTTDTQLQFNGDMQVAYCNEGGKILYEVYFPEDDVVEE